MLSQRLSDTKTPEPLKPLIVMKPLKAQLPQGFHAFSAPQRFNLRPLLTRLIFRIKRPLPRKIQIPLTFRQIAPGALASMGNP